MGLGLPAGENSTPFNMALMYYMSLNKLWEQKDEAYIKADVFSWYLGIRVMYRKICFKISKETKIEIEKELNKVKGLLENQTPTIKTAEQKRDFVTSDIAEKLEKIDMRLINILSSNGMIFPKIDNSSGLDKVKGRYGL